jgi:hypothetical protein
MNSLFKAIALSVLFLHTAWATADDTPSPTTTEENHSVTLEEAVKLVMKDNTLKVLSAKTEVIEGKKVHIIKVLTADGRIQYIKIEAATGKFIENINK